MLTRLDLFWRYFLTGLVCIALSSVLTLLTLNQLDKLDNQATFAKETKQFLTFLTQEMGLSSEQEINIFLKNLEEDDIPFNVSFSNDASHPLDTIRELSENVFSTTYYSTVTNNRVTLTDKQHLDGEDDHPSESDILLNLYERIAWLTLIIAFLGGSFYLIDRKTRSHIQLLIDASTNISRGKFDTVVPTDSPEPIRQLALQLDTTRNNIIHLLEKERTFAFAIPHELRTPLSKIRLALDLSRKNQSVQDYEYLIEDLDRYTDDLQTLIDDMMQLAKSDAPIPLSTIDLNNLLDSIVRSYLLIFPDRSITVDCQISTVESAEPQLRTILNNLINNAVVHGEKEIDIEIFSRGDNTVIRISNDGQSVPNSQKDKIFMPFYRLDQSRSRQNGNAGIGLALVKHAVQQLSGQVSVVRHEQYATCVEVVL